MSKLELRPLRSHGRKQCFPISAVFLVVLVLLLVVIYKRFKTMQNSEVDMTMESFRIRGKCENKKTDNSCFCLSDIPWVDDVLKFDPKSLSEVDAMNKFYYYIAFPIQGVCRYVYYIKYYHTHFP